MRLQSCSRSVCGQCGTGITGSRNHKLANTQFGSTRNGHSKASCFERTRWIDPLILEKQCIQAELLAEPVQCEQGSVPLSQAVAKCAIFNRKKLSPSPHSCGAAGKGPPIQLL